MRSCLAAQTPLASITQPGPAETCSQRWVFPPAAALFVPDSREKHLAAPPGVTSGGEGGPAHPGRRSRGMSPAPRYSWAVAVRQWKSTWDRSNYNILGEHHRASHAGYAGSKHRPGQGLAAPSSFLHPAQISLEKSFPRQSPCPALGFFLLFPSCSEPALPLAISDTGTHPTASPVQHPQWNLTASTRGAWCTPGPGFLGQSQHFWLSWKRTFF